MPSRNAMGQQTVLAGIDPAGNPKRPTGLAILDERLHLMALETVRSDAEAFPASLSGREDWHLSSSTGPSGFPKA